MTSATFLDRILPRTRDDLEERRRRLPLAALKARLQDAPAPLDFAAALAGPGLNLIAEVKKSSPSRGQLLRDLDVSALARTYVENGASAISVLTDVPFFQGSLEDLAAVRAVAAPAGVPVLRKDFLVDPYQLYEARLWGADAALLIAAILTEQQLQEFLTLTRWLGMEALVEVHTPEETKRALEAGAQVIGINNRDLTTFTTDLETTARLIGHIPADRTVVSESGIFARQDGERLHRLGVGAILVGEALITARDTAQKVRELSRRE